MLLECLKQHPNDPVVLKYLGKQYLHEGRRRLGLTMLHRMERVCRNMAENDQSDPDSWWNLGDIAEITGRRTRAQYCFRKAETISLQLTKKETEADDRQYYVHFARNAAERIAALRRKSQFGNRER